MTPTITSSDASTTLKKEVKIASSLPPSLTLDVKVSALPKLRERKKRHYMHKVADKSAVPVSDVATALLKKSHAI